MRRSPHEGISARQSCSRRPARPVNRDAAQLKNRSGRRRATVGVKFVARAGLFYLLAGARAQGNGTVDNSTNPISMLVMNNCPNTIWPGILTQAGVGPGTGGFELSAGTSSQLWLSADWAGRVWGRTNCSFNEDGSGAANLAGVNGNGAACTTGDCFAKLSCEFAGTVPATLVEFTFLGGVNHNQTFYDISIVDGYNLPMGIVYKPTENTTWIPPNLTNAACIATADYLAPPARTGIAHTNASYPMPYESSVTNSQLSSWCPWNLQAFPPSKPGDGVYPYPDDDIQRPVFDPCLSSCAATNSPEDCCTGAYDTPDTCPPSMYSAAAKVMCPDAYSYPYDDHNSTFVIPAGGGWEVVFCPEGRSTDILATFGHQLRMVAESARLPAEVLLKVTNMSLFETHVTSGAGKMG